MDISRQFSCNEFAVGTRRVHGGDELPNLISQSVLPAVFQC
jgi:hypothetical protein